MLSSTLSSAWAVGAALRGLGLSPPPDHVIFGLGGSAAYRLETGAAPVLRPYHPDRIRRSLNALNVFAARFNYLSDDVAQQLRERTRAGLQTLVTVDRWALPVPAAGDAPAPGCDQGYTLLVHADEQAADGSGYRVQGPDDAVPWHLSENALLRAWFVREGGQRCATFHWHLVVTLQWTPAASMRRSLQEHAALSVQRHPGLPASGLHALQGLGAQGDAELADALLRTARCAAADGGPGLGRDILAAYLREAADVLGAAPLHAAAERCDAVAGLWRDLLHEALHGRLQAASARAALAGVQRHEQQVLQDLASAACTGTGARHA